MTDLRISEVRLVAASRSLRDRGLEAWVSFTIDNRLRVDGVTLRRGRDGRRFLSFPSRWDDAGREHPFLRPLGQEDRAEVERQVFASIRVREEATP